MAFNNKSKLPDTPWHVGYAYKEENDPRRHKAWCIHLHKGICKCGLSGCYMTHCAGSSHCKYYAEGQAQWDAYLEEMKTDVNGKIKYTNFGHEKYTTLRH